MSVQVDVVVGSPLWSQTPEAEKAVRQAIAACETLFEPVDAEIAVLLCDDAEIRRLNARWRGKDAATNVLSFPASQNAAGRHLGDIAVSYETLAREASDERKMIVHHLSHLTVHGYLHLLGFDHETDDEADEMEGLEREILADLGIGDPYQAAHARQGQGAR